MEELKFEKFPKIPRINGKCTITEKIDGSNGLIAFNEEGEMLVGSRKRQIYPEIHMLGYKGSDNFGFAQWAYKYKEELFEFLGKGYHYGEWAGQGIQRGYGLREKRFFLFNTKRFTSEGWIEKQISTDIKSIEKQILTDDIKSIGLDVVPVLYEGNFHPVIIDYCMKRLETYGSIAISYDDAFINGNFDNPEGIVIWLNGHYYKHTFEYKGGKWNENRNNSEL